MKTAVDDERQGPRKRARMSSRHGDSRPSASLVRVDDYAEELQAETSSYFEDARMYNLKLQPQSLRLGLQQQQVSQGALWIQ